MDTQQYALVVRHITEKAIDWPDELAWEPHAVLDRVDYSKLKVGDIIQQVIINENGISKWSEPGTGHSFFRVENNNVFVGIPTPEIKFWYA